MSLCEVDTLRNLYTQRQMSTRAVGKTLGISHSCVRDRLIHADIPLRRRGDYTPAKRRYMLDLSPLNDLTEDSAYVLGFVFAEGCYSNNGGTSRRLTIVQKDGKEILRAIGKVLGYNGQITEVKTDISCLSITSYKLTVLEKYGLKPGAKSGSIRMPKLPENLFGSFFRGYFDGDGTVDNHNHGKGVRFRFTSASRGFLDDLHMALTNYGCSGGGVSLVHNGHTEDTYYCLGFYSHRDVAIIRDLMYGNGGICISRKRNAALLAFEVMEKCRSTIMNA